MAEPILYRATAGITIKAEPEKVFDAWLDPLKMARFMAPTGTTSMVEADPREGGAFSVLMKHEGGEIEHYGRYVLIDRPRRLIFTWLSPNTDWRLSLVTVMFTPVEGGVRVDLEHEGLPNADQAANHQRGWGTILAKLADHLQPRAER